MVRHLRLNPLGADSLTFQVSSAFLLISQTPDSIYRHFRNPNLPFDTVTLARPTVQGLVDQKAILVPPVADSVRWMYIKSVFHLDPPVHNPVEEPSD